MCACEARGQSLRSTFAAIALTEANGHEIVQISDVEARSIQIEFERELSRIAASAAVGFPVPDAIPGMGARPSAERGQQTCPNCHHPMAMHTSMGCRECGCSRPSGLSQAGRLRFSFCIEGIGVSAHT